MISSTVVAPFICLLAVPTTADLLRPFHRPEADPGAFFDVSRSLETGKPLKISNLCPDVIYPGIVTQHGVGPESHGFELKPGTSRQMVVSPDWFGRVWGRTNCSFNAEGTGASNRDVLYGGGKACVTGDCNGMLDCRVSVSRYSPGLFQIVGKPNTKLMKRFAFPLGRPARHSLRDPAEIRRGSAVLLRYLLGGRLQPSDGDRGITFGYGRCAFRRHSSERQQPSLRCKRGLSGRSGLRSLLDELVYRPWYQQFLSDAL